MPENKINGGKSRPQTISKKPYSKPEFKHERMFETMALACGKLGSSQLQCRSNSNVS
jgi:hypothetical protein